MGPENLEGTKAFRLFISHIITDKLIATRLKDALAPYENARFGAQEDTHPTLPWQDEIGRALPTMDALIAVHTPGFSASIWTQQEIGYALGRGTMIISFKMGEHPPGFIDKHQALPRRNRTAAEIAKEIERLLEVAPAPMTDWHKLVQLAFHFSSPSSIPAKPALPQLTLTMRPDQPETSIPFRAKPSQRMWTSLPLSPKSEVTCPRKKNK